MAEFNEQLPDWQEAGIEPPPSKKTAGWQVNDKPPAGWLNWLFNRTYKVLAEIRSVFSAHAGDNTRHLTAAERTAWNAKETPGGAQTKADAAEAAAKAASIPLAQKGAAGGVAELNSARLMSAAGEIYDGTHITQVVRFSFAHGVANQKIDLWFTGNYSGYIDVSLTGLFANQASDGLIKKRINLTAAAPSTINVQTSQYVDVTGNMRGCLSISDVSYDATNNRWRIVIESRTSAGNTYAVKVEGMNAGLVQSVFALGPVYTGAPTTLPMAIQIIPDDTTTVSGYKIQKHKLTTDNGRAIPLPTAIDLNYVQDTGIYDGYGLINAPSDGYYYVEVVGHSNGPEAWKKQRATALSGTASSPVVYERIMQGGIWGNWLLSVGNGVFKIKGLVQSNFNDYVEPGTYQLFGAIDLPNGPPLSAPWAIVNVFKGSNGYVVQEVTQTTSPYAKWYRGRTETAWSPWQKILTDINTDTLMKSKGYLPANTDINSVTLPGIWTLIGDWVYINGVPGLNAYGTLEVYESGGIVKHVFTVANDANTTFCRMLTGAGGGTWTAWVEVITSSSAAVFVKRGPVASGTDLGFVDTPGMYFLAANSSYINGSGLDWCVMNVFTNSVGYVVQEVTGIGSVGRRFRIRTELGGWGEWMMTPFTTVASGKYSGITANRSNVNDVVVGDTIANIVVTSHTAAIKSNYEVKVYLRVTAPVTITLALWYADASGARTHYFLQNKFIDTADGYCLVPAFVNSMPGGMSLVITVSVAGVVYISSTIQEV